MVIFVAVVFARVATVGIVCVAHQRFTLSVLVSTRSVAIDTKVTSIAGEDLLGRQLNRVCFVVDCV